MSVDTTKPTVRIEDPSGIEVGDEAQPFISRDAQVIEILSQMLAKLQEIADSLHNIGG